MEHWSLDERDGELVVLTGREGRAARMGHRLSIEMTRWRAEVTEGDDGPVAASLVIEVAGLQVRSGEGGVLPMSSGEREVARRQALRTLGAKHHPLIEFVADQVETTSQGYDLVGELSIHGVSRPRRIQVQTSEEGGVTTLRSEETVRHSDHDVKPVTFMLGALRVSDAVSVSLTASRR